MKFNVSYQQNVSKTYSGIASALEFITNGYSRYFILCYLIVSYLRKFLIHLNIFSDLFEYHLAFFILSF